MMANDQLSGVRFYPDVEVPDDSPGRRDVAVDKFALYIHIPFCDKLCHFCDYAVVAGQQATGSIVDQYLGALKEEMKVFLGTMANARAVVKTIQLGGGTPTSLSAEALDDLIDFILDHFNCAEVSDVIVEGFPTSITRDRLGILRRIPSVKLNIGIQTFHPQNLELIGREHGFGGPAAIKRAQDAGIQSIGVDIMFGLPGGSSDKVKADLETTRELGAEHVALYPLWIYDRTALDSRVRAGKIQAPNFEAQYEQLIVGTQVMASLGYHRYSAFHHALTEAAKHCYGVWQMCAKDIVGFGMSAMSYLNGELFFNDRSIRGYMDKIHNGIFDVARSRRLSPAALKRFALLYGLRLRPYPSESFAERFGKDVREVFVEELSILERQGLITLSKKSIELTPIGILELGTIEKFIKESRLGFNYPLGVDALATSGHMEVIDTGGSH